MYHEMDERKVDGEQMKSWHDRHVEIPEVCDFVKTILDLRQFSQAALRQHMESCDPQCHYHQVCRAIAAEGVIQIELGGKE